MPELWNTRTFGIIVHGSSWRWRTTVRCGPRIHLTTDCGQFALPRQIARGKLAAMAKAAEHLRGEIG
jgi:hypothetical protein